ncbi:MAG: acyltransferase domain-containing protein, partial [Luteolibacter sp.]
ADALWMRRDMLPHRALCLTDDRQDLIQSLRDGFEGKSTTLIQSQALASARKPVFVFTGNGAQWIGMGRKLYAESETFRVAVDEVETIFADYANFSLLPHFQTDAATQLDRTELAQPLIFAIQVGLVRCLAAAGITPSATLGHSLGEVAAAWAAGALELEQAVKVIRLRSKHQQLSQNQGGMTVVAAPRKEVEALLGHPSLDGIEVVVSGENSPRAVTLAGEESALTVFEAVMQERSMSFKRLDLPYPFHSPQMDAIAQGFTSELGELFVEGSNLPFYSTVTGRMEAGPLGTEYWQSNIREPVLFRDAVEAAINDEHRVFIEIGPHPVLASHVLHTLQAKRVEGHAVGIITKDQDSAADLSATLWKLILGGVGYDWSRHFCFPPSRVAELPHYPWQMETYALPVSSEGGGLVSNDKEHPLLGYRAHGKDWVWENHLDTTGMPWLADHQVGGRAGGELAQPLDHSQQRTRITPTRLTGIQPIPYLLQPLIIQHRPCPPPSP